MITYFLVLDRYNKLICKLSDESTAKAAARHHNGIVVYITRRA